MIVEHGGVTGERFYDSSQIQRNAESVIGKVGNALADVLGIGLGLQFGDLPAALRIAEDIPITGCGGIVGVSLAGVGVRLADGNLLQLGDKSLHAWHPSRIVFQLIHGQHGTQHAPLAVDVGPVFGAGRIPRSIRPNLAIKEAVFP